MSLLKTFVEIKMSRVVQVAAACPDSDEFRSLVNSATDYLLQRGDWPGTVIPARFLVNRGCITWPRFVQRVRRINACRNPLKMGTVWTDFVPQGNYEGWCGSRFYEWGGTSAPVGQYSFGLHGRGFGSLVSQGRVPTYNDVPGDTPRYVRAYPLCPADVGKTITFFGVDGNNQPLMTLNTDGSYSQGVTITLASPFGQTSVHVQRIDAVRKDLTQLSVPVYAYDPVSDTQLDLAIYEPNEFNPSYAKDRLFDIGRPECNCPMTVIALVKLAFVPVYADTDYVLIPSETALATAIQAVKYRESGDINSHALFMQSAVNDLNSVLNNEIPIEQTPVNEGFEASWGTQSVL